MTNAPHIVALHDTASKWRPETYYGNRTVYDHGDSNSSLYSRGARSLVSALPSRAVHLPCLEKACCELAAPQASLNGV